MPRLRRTVIVPIVLGAAGIGACEIEEAIGTTVYERDDIVRDAGRTAPFHSPRDAEPLPEPCEDAAVSCEPVGCQTRQLVDAGRCGTRCVDGPVQTACINGDGCCAPGCNANTDDDCSPVCGNDVKERGETCDPPSSCTCPVETKTCYVAMGSASGCNLVCHRPARCGGASDGCCPYAGGACGTGEDTDCAGTRWRVVALGSVDTATDGGCATVTLGSLAAGGSYAVTTCSPPNEPEPGNGDPAIVSVVDESGRSYGSNEDCADRTALPHLAGSKCENAKGVLTMPCWPESPGGLRFAAAPASLTVTICARGNAGAKTPLYVWYNAASAPTRL
jgi:hypothetical protein